MLRLLYLLQDLSLEELLDERDTCHQFRMVGSNRGHGLWWGGNLCWCFEFGLYFDCIDRCGYLQYLQTYLPSTDITFRYLHHIFTIRIRKIIAVIIRYPQIGNGPILNDFENNG
jgi:hypothetical protein